jgi:hypothetical protein
MKRRINPESFYAQRREIKKLKKEIKQWSVDYFKLKNENRILNMRLESNIKKIKDGAQ